MKKDLRDLQGTWELPDPLEHLESLAVPDPQVSPVRKAKKVRWAHLGQKDPPVCRDPPVQTVLVVNPARKDKPVQMDFPVRMAQSEWLELQEKSAKPVHRVHRESKVRKVIRVLLGFVVSKGRQVNQVRKVLSARKAYVAAQVVKDNRGQSALRE